MRMRSWGIAAAAGMATMAHAQTTMDASIAYSLTWCDTGNNNGVLEPGESAQIRMTATLSPSIGTLVEYTGAGATQVGTLRGIASGFLDINSQGLNGGSWSELWMDPEWDLVGATGTPISGGNTLQNIQFGQFPFNLGEVNSTNPIRDFWRGTLTPSSYDERTMTLNPFFGLGGHGHPSAVIIQTGVPVPTAIATVMGLHQFISLQIPIVPAPASLMVLAAGAFLQSRRGRR